MTDQLPGKKRRFGQCELMTSSYAGGKGRETMFGSHETQIGDEEQ